MYNIGGISRLGALFALGLTAASAPVYDGYGQSTKMKKPRLPSEPSDWRESAKPLSKRQKRRIKGKGK